MKKVVVTGSEGSVGRILTGRSLAENRSQLNAEITRVDLKDDLGDSKYPFIQSDLKDRDQITELLKGNDVFIHGAWNTQEGILRPDVVDPENLETVRRILECAEALGSQAAKIVLLSSVNAHVPENWRERRAANNPIGVDEEPQPNRHNRNGEPGNGVSHYGQSKVTMEQAGKAAAEKGLHIVIPRLGGVNLKDLLSSEHETHQDIYADPERGLHFDAKPHGWEDASRLSHADLIADLQDVIDFPKVPGTFEHYNLVSNTADRVHKIKSDS